MVIKSNRMINLSRDEHRKIKRYKKNDMEALLSGIYGMAIEDEREEIRAEILRKSQEVLEKAIDIKGIGPERKAMIRRKYKEAMEEKEHDET